MADEADKAAKAEERAREAALTHRRDEGPISACGTCHWCDAPVGPKQKFCDSDCEQDWSRDRERELRPRGHR